MPLSHKHVQTVMALRRIAAAFWPFEKVVSVQVQRFRSEFQVNVLVSVAKYDYVLMDALFDAELDLRKTLPEVVLSFSYTPIGTQRSHVERHPSARVLFTRADCLGSRVRRQPNRM